MGKQASWQSAHLKKTATQGSTHTVSLMGAGRQLPQAGSSRQELRWLQGVISRAALAPAATRVHGLLRSNHQKSIILQEPFSKDFRL